jgi:protease-4
VRYKEMTNEHATTFLYSVYSFWFVKKVVKEEHSVLKVILTVIGIISGLLSLAFFGFVFFIFVSAVSEPTTFAEGNIAVIPIEGVITTEGGSGNLMSSEVVQWIREAESDDTIQAVIFRVNSPGGSPVATEEIARAIEEMDKPSVAVIREIGASGAYWVASATDRIYASRMSLVGSIGVLASYIEFAGTLERYNATYRSLTAGEFKDTGSPFKELTPREEAMFQKQLDALHDIFIQAVAENRGLPEDKVRKIANGWVYTGDESLENGLIDAIGNEDDAIYDLEQELNITAELVEFQSPPTLFGSLLGVVKDSSYFVGRGIGDSLTEPHVQAPVKVWT